MAIQKIKAFGLELTPEEWTQQSICRCSANEIREGIRRGLHPEDVVTARSQTKRRFRGVSFHKAINRWIAQIKVDSKVIFLGSFENDIDAAKAFDEAARPLGRECNFAN